MARLCGARLVTTAETEGNHRLGESLIKQVTGSDPVEARHLYKEPFEFIPAFKLVLATNHKPIVSGNDFAIWRRLHLVPFTEQIADEDCIPNYHENLLDEAAGILNWALEGCLEWQNTGLVAPSAVVYATNEYRDEQDIVTQFLHEAEFLQSEIPRAEVYRIYIRWAETNCKEVISNIRLYEELVQYGCKVKTVNGTKIMTGLLAGDDRQDKDDEWDFERHCFERQYVLQNIDFKSVLHDYSKKLPDDALEKNNYLNIDDEQSILQSEFVGENLSLETDSSIEPLSSL